MIINVSTSPQHYCEPGLFFPIPSDSPKGAGGESSLDEDSSDALSPDQLTNHDSPLGSIPQLSPSDMLTQNGDMSPSQVSLAGSTLMISEGRVVDPK